MTSSYIFSKIAYCYGQPYMHDDIADISFYNLSDCTRWEHMPELGDIITFLTNDKREGRLVAVKINRNMAYLPNIKANVQG